MSWAVGYDDKWKRDIGYGVLAYCDHPDCGAEIDRGLSFVCADEEPYGGENGCGLYFCGKHRGFTCKHKGFAPTPDHPDWIAHKLTHPSWQQWRDENPEEVSAMENAHAGEWESPTVREKARRASMKRARRPLHPYQEGRSE